MMASFRNTLVIISLILLAAGSCKNSSKKDLSYTVKEYKMKGMPDPDSVWSDKGCLKAHAALGTIRLNHFTSLPAKHSKKSGPVFTRIINRENVSFIDDTTESLSDRAFRVQYFSSFIAEICRMYTDNLKQEQYYREELIDLYIFRLFVQEKMLYLADVIMKSDDPSVKGLKQGLAAVQHGYINLLSQLFQEQVKINVYLADDLVRLSQEISVSLLRNLEWMNEENREGIRNHLHDAIEKSSSEMVKTNYRKSLDAFQAAHP
jgi:hypothetical protein